MHARQIVSALLFCAATAVPAVAADPSIGTPVVFASGLTGPEGIAATRTGDLGLSLADGIAFDARGNLLVVGAGILSVVDPDTRAVTPLTSAAPLDWPSNIAFGRRGFARRTMYLANFGPMLGDGTEVIAVPYSIRGARVIR